MICLHDTVPWVKSEHENGTEGSVCTHTTVVLVRSAFRIVHVFYMRNVVHSYSIKFHLFFNGVDLLKSSINSSNINV